MASTHERTSSEESPADESKLEKGEGEQQGPPKPVGFFHPALNKVRKQVFLMWARTSKLINTWTIFDDTVKLIMKSQP